LSNGATTATELEPDAVGGGVAVWAKAVEGNKAMDIEMTPAVAVVTIPINLTLLRRSFIVLSPSAFVIRIVDAFVDRPR
jgi:hypothetical protein